MDFESNIVVGRGNEYAKFASDNRGESVPSGLSYNRTPVVKSSRYDRNCIQCRAHPISTLIIHETRNCNVLCQSCATNLGREGCKTCPSCGKSFLMVFHLDTTESEKRNRRDTRRQKIGDSSNVEYVQHEATPQRETLGVPWRKLAIGLLAYVFWNGTRHMRREERSSTSYTDYFDHLN